MFIAVGLCTKPHLCPVSPTLPLTHGDGVRGRCCWWFSYAVGAPEAVPKAVVWCRWCLCYLTSLSTVTGGVCTSAGVWWIMVSLFFCWQAFLIHLLLLPWSQAINLTHLHCYLLHAKDVIPPILCRHNSFIISRILQSKCSFGGKGKLLSKVNYYTCNSLEKVKATLNIKDKQVHNLWI